ncbi:UHRF1-binding protein 1-like protein [Cucumis melo var. makuwa]|uniref:UHRF1-binding protein 1-like protein n=1 Tax=Cucumis melo var. makuwa TaxID=1194695 RepID=A0A5D3BYG6_CUCMM|nr:UHRF1-binding protein 1-like protein [Cucumis melo var. makuwa]
MMGKLRRLQGNLKVWNRDVFGDIRLRKKEILGRIEEIHCLELGGPLERSLRVEREDLKRVFVELIRKENVSWNRKAKIKWVKEGDCNTSFFHRVASCRKSKNHIGSLLLESGLEKLLFQDAFVLRIISPKCPKTEGFLDYDPGDTFSRPPCTLVQPAMQAVIDDFLHVPEFARNFCPPIYPFKDKQWGLSGNVPLLCLHSVQVKPSPVPPSFASQTVIHCQPLTIHLQEKSCLRISSFLADGIVVNPGSVLPDFSISSIVLSLKELDVSVPLDVAKSTDYHGSWDGISHCSFDGARLHIKNMQFSESPSLNLRLLNLDKDPACFLLWEGQPVDASQKKWSTSVSQISLSLETYNKVSGSKRSDAILALLRCVELTDVSIEVAMATADGRTLTAIPPPGGVVRVGVSCQQYLSNTSVDQLFFVLDLYAYFGRVTEKIALVGKKNRPKESGSNLLVGKLVDKVPSDTAVSLLVRNLQLRFLESSSTIIEELPLVQFVGNDMFIKVSHRTLGGAVAITSTVRWDNVEVDCVDTEGNTTYDNGTVSTSIENGSLMNGNELSRLRAILWVHNKGDRFPTPFLDVSIVHVIPLNERDMECHSLNVSACIAGVRLSGGMNYAEALLHRFGILGLDGGPGKGLMKGLENLRAGPLVKLFKTSPLLTGSLEGDGKESSLLQLGKPDDVDVSIELKNWLFALEGAQEMAERWWFYNPNNAGREERCWHTSFQSFRVKAQSRRKDPLSGKGSSLGSQQFPVELVIMSVEGLQTLKPQAQKNSHHNVSLINGVNETIEPLGGINLEARMVVSEDNVDVEMANWIMENLKFSVKHPIEAVVTKNELQHLALLFKSEVDSMGRIAAGILRLLKLEGSIGQATLDQLSNLGSESIDKIFTPEKLSRGSSLASLGVSPSAYLIGESPRPTIESTVTSLEQAVLDSQSKCTSLMTELSSSDSSSHVATIKQLHEKLDSMQTLLSRLRNQI